MLKIFRFIFGKNNRNMVFAYQIKNELLGESKLVDSVLEMDQYMTRSLERKRDQ